MKKTVVIMALAAALATVGCKKKSSEGTTDTPGSGSAAMTASGSDMMAGSGSAMTMAGSGSAMTMAGSGTGSAMMAGSDSGKTAEPPRPASVTDAMVATAEKAITQMEKLGGELEAAGTDCKKATAAISAAAPGISASIAEMEKMKPDADPAAREWFKAHYGARADVMGNAMGKVMATCKDDKDFAAAVQKLGMVKKKAPPSDVDSGAQPVPTK